MRAPQLLELGEQLTVQLPVAVGIILRRGDATGAPYCGGCVCDCGGPWHVHAAEIVRKHIENARFVYDGKVEV